MSDRDLARCAAAATYLAQVTADRAEHPPLWIDKCLYVPPLIVNAAIEAALADPRPDA
jgi:hypothetical protein